MMIRIVCAYLCLLLLSASVSVAADRPNVVVILADDQGWGDLGSNGNANLSTPRIDALGRQGATLERFFVCPVCAPTRAEFLTGRYHLRGGVRGVSTGLERLNLDERTVAEAFQAAGYATGLFGKWHNGSQWPYHPNARGFKEFYGFTSGHWGEYFNPPLEHNGQFVRGKEFIADDFTEHALEFVELNRAKPFFCFLSFNTPHSPFSVPDEYWNRFKDRPIGQRGNEGDREDLAVTRAALALCENIDENVGRVLRKLDDLKLSEDTIVVYFSDNGPNSARWNGGMKGRKGSTDEGGVRAPCLIRWPGRIKPGTKVPVIAGAIDLLPTLADLTGVARVGSRVLDGRSLAPLLLAQQATWPDRLIFSHQNGQVSVRSQGYRLDASGALFDMEQDPSQRHDIASQQPEMARRLGEAVSAWKQDVTNARAPVSRLDFALSLLKDERPIPVGFAEFPMTPLPARDGLPGGGIKRSAPAPNCSYFVNWKSVEGVITWPIEVHTAGDYEVVLFYTCPTADVGSRVELSFGPNRREGRVAPAWDPPLIDNQDRVARKGESIMKEFRPLNLGTIHLEQGRGPLTLRAVEIPGQSVMDLRLLTLTLKQK